MSKTKIDWCDEVWNPVTGCSKVSDGCKNCYAEKMASRLQKMGCKKYANGFKVECHEDELVRTFPGKGKRIFVNSMSDLFHEEVTDDFILDVEREISEPWNRKHTFIILTKRPKRMMEFYEKYKRPYPLPNLWLGVSVENQAAADARIPILLKTPAALRFVSVEPMLEAIDLGEFLPAWDENGYSVNQLTAKNLDWVICGGESGANSRPLHPDWVRSMRDQCESAGVPFFFKQWGSWEPFYDREKDDPDWRNIPKEIPGKICRINIVGGQGFHGERVVYFRKSKIEHLPLLDGKIWNQIPEIN